MDTQTRTRKPVHRPSRAELLDRLDAAMHAWARREREPAAFVHRLLDELHAAWAAVRLEIGDEFQVDAPPTTPATAPTVASRRSADQANRTRAARELKAADDAERERFVVKRYAQVVRRAATAKAAREIVAREVREGRHLVDGALGGDGRAAYAATFGEKSVARILRRFAAR